MLGPRHQQPGRHVDSGHALGQGDAGEARRPHDRHAVGNDQVTAPAGFAQLRVAAHHAEEGRVHGDHGVRRARSDAPLEATVDRGLHGHAVERAPEQLDSIAPGHEHPSLRPSARVPRARATAAASFSLRVASRLPPQETRVLVAPDEAPESLVVVAGHAACRAREVAPQHGDAADEHGVLRQAVDGAGQQIEGRGAHEVLAVAGAHPAGPDALLARSHGPQMQEAQALVVHALRDPAQHAAAVAVDPVPHHLPHEAADLAEAWRSGRTSSCRPTSRRRRPRGPASPYCGSTK